MRKSPPPRRTHAALKLTLAALVTAGATVLTASAITGAPTLVIAAIVAVTVCSTVIVIPVGVVIDLRRDAARARRLRAEEARARAVAEKAERAYREANRGPLGAARRLTHKMIGRPTPHSQRIVDSFAFPSRGGYSHPYAAPFPHPGGGWDMFAPTSMLLTAVAIETAL